MEIVKDRLYNPGRRGKEARQSAQLGVYSALLSVLKTMAPIMPYITEEIYQLHFAKAENCQSIHISEWPKFDPKLINEKAEVIGDLGVDLINAVRKFKSENKMSMKDGLSEIVILGKEKELKPILEDLKAVCKAKEIKFSGPADSETELFKIKVGIKK
jgi:valyl-tRNA synthetase